MFVTGGGGPEYAWKGTCGLEGRECERNPEIVCINRYLVLSGRLLSTDDKTFFIEDFDVGSYMRDWGTTWSRHGALPDGAAGIGIHWDARHEALFGKIIVPEADAEPAAEPNRLDLLRARLIEVKELIDSVTDKALDNKADPDGLVALHQEKDRIIQEIDELEAMG